jgi:LDH2 family malate/lactate/ureidoglycolate dehydrogenase
MSAGEAIVLADEARRFCQEMIREIKAAPRAEGVAEIYLPGELEFRRRGERLQQGLPLSAVVLEEARTIGRELGVAWPA